MELRLLAAFDEGNPESIRDLLATEPFLLGPRYLETQEKLLAVAACSEGKLAVIEAVITAGAAITTAAEPPASRAVLYALEYGNADYVSALSQIWPVPDDLPHAAGLGNMEAVAKRFANGFPRLGRSILVCLPTRGITIGQCSGDRRQGISVGGAERELRDRGLSPGSRREYQHEMEYPRAGQYPARMRLRRPQWNRWCISFAKGST